MKIGGGAKISYFGQIQPLIVRKYILHLPVIGAVPVAHRVPDVRPCAGRGVPPRAQPYARHHSTYLVREKRFFFASEFLQTRLYSVADPDPFHFGLPSKTKKNISKNKKRLALHHAPQLCLLKLKLKAPF